jgi:hypothetical protein
MHLCAWRFYKWCFMSVLCPLTKILLLHNVQEFLVKLKNLGLGSLHGTTGEVWGIKFYYVSGSIIASRVCVFFILLSSPLITRILQVTFSCYEQGICLIPKMWKMWSLSITLDCGKCFTSSWWWGIEHYVSWQDHH